MYNSKKAKLYSQNKEFWDLYQNKIVPGVKNFDNERQSGLHFAVIGTMFFIVLGLLCTYWLITLYPKGGELWFLNLLLYIIAYCIPNVAKKTFECSLKEKIMPIICRSYRNLEWRDGSDKSYNPGQIFEQSYVIPWYNTVLGDDIFSGIYKDIAFEIVEAEFIKKDPFSRYNKFATVFKGVIVKLAINKKFSSHTVIVPKFSSQVDTSPYLKHMALGDVVFDKKYSVFTTDKVEARCLITPSFIKWLGQIKLAFHAKKISCAFYNDLFFIAIPTNKDLFSIGSLVKHVDDPKQYYQLYEEIESIIKLIDYFKLESNIR